MDPKRLLDRLLRGSLNNVRLADARALVEALGFRPMRTTGSHHIFGHAFLPQLLTLQNVRGEAKPYQLRQLPPPDPRVRFVPGGRRVSRRYHINVFYSDEDGGYIADIPDLDACSAFGATPEEAVAEVEKAKAARLAAAADAGRTIPEARYKPAARA